MSGNASRLPAVISPPVGSAVAKVTTVVAIPFKPEVFTEAHLKSPLLFTASMNRLTQSIGDVTRSQRANPLGTPHVYEDLVCGTAGALVKIQHGFGRRVFFNVVRWSGAATTAPILVCDELDASPMTDSNTLALRSYVAGTVAIAVY